MALKSVGASALTLGTSSISLVWLLGLSLLSLALITIRSGLTRVEGALIIAGYAGFLAFLLQRALS